MKMHGFLAALPLLLGLTGVPALAQSSSSRQPSPPFFQVLGQVQTPKLALLNLEWVKRRVG
jgi:hypothetical protein